ncbi:energy transducer TonB [Capnocytophaga cynodegmi]|uniref:energy transducer TonB family protein n=1 Tax=Capnocytophaga cynodegmi TaxID=28189 RepID=UPI003858A4A2
MSLIDTEHKRKSLAITTTIMGLIVILLFFAGMKYLDPPPESGVDVIFGVDVRGMGEKSPPPSASKPQPSRSEETSKPEESTSESVKENLLAQDNEEEIAVPNEPKKKEKQKETPKKEKSEKTPNKQPTEKPKEEPKPSKEATDALSSILGASNANGNSSGGQGDDNVVGYKGSPDGDPYASSYYGSGGSGTGGKGWGLKGRSIEAEGKVLQDCNESGTVVVQIEVDQNGNVVKATPGVRGSTSREACLLEAARKTAFKHKWNADSKAPSRQIGFIVINFKLGE